jgi:uncharacterized protein YhhL (DUF1145 family)
MWTINLNLTNDLEMDIGFSFINIIHPFNVNLRILIEIIKGKVCGIV